MRFSLNLFLIGIFCALSVTNLSGGTFTCKCAPFILHTPDPTKPGERRLVELDEDNCSIILNEELCEFKSKSNKGCIYRIGVWSEERGCYFSPEGESGVQ